MEEDVALKFRWKNGIQPCNYITGPLVNLVAVPRVVGFLMDCPYFLYQGL